MNLNEIIIDEKRAIDKESESSMAIVKSYIQKYGVDNVYLSFRESIHTSSINKNNRYDTPTGYYAYPLHYYFQDRVLDEYTWGEFVGKFPFAGNREFVAIFTITNKSGVLYTLAPDTGKIAQYVSRIKQSYGATTTGYSKIGEVCDSFSAGTWNSDYEGGFKEGNEVRKFWLFLYAIAGLIIGGGDRRSNTVSIIAKKIGLLGVCDDAGLGVIHPNERAQIVLFYGFTSIVGDFRIISSFAQRQDVPLPIDDRNYSKENMENNLDKFIRFLEKKLGYKSNDFTFVGHHSNEKIKYLQNFKIGKPIPVVIKRGVGESGNSYLPYFITKDFKIGTDGITLDEIDGAANNSILRAAYINSNHRGTSKLKSCRSFQNIGGEMLAVAGMLDNEGHEYSVYVNENGESKIPKDFDLEWKSPSDNVVYLNTIAGYGKFNHVGRFSPTPDGRKLATAYFSKNSEYPYYINENGEIDPTGYGLKISIDTPKIDLAVIVNSKNGKPILNRDNIYAVNERDNHLAIQYDYEYGNFEDTQIYNFFDANGKLDLNGINPDTLDNAYMLAGYYNQLRDVKVFKEIYSTEVPNIFIGVDIYTNKKFFIDKLTGEPSVEGADNLDQTIYNNTMKLINNGVGLKSIEKVSNNTNDDNSNIHDLDIFESHEKLLDVISEALENLLT